MPTGPMLEGTDYRDRQAVRQLPRSSVFVSHINTHIRKHMHTTNTHSLIFTINAGHAGSGKVTVCCCCRQWNVTRPLLSHLACRPLTWASLWTISHSLAAEVHQAAHSQRWALLGKPQNFLYCHAPHNGNRAECAVTEVFYCHDVFTESGAWIWHKKLCCLSHLVSSSRQTIHRRMSTGWKRGLWSDMSECADDNLGTAGIKYSGKRTHIWGYLWERENISVGNGLWI